MNQTRFTSLFADKIFIQLITINGRSDKQNNKIIYSTATNMTFLKNCLVNFLATGLFFIGRIIKIKIYFHTGIVWYLNTFIRFLV